MTWSGRQECYSCKETKAEQLCSLQVSELIVYNVVMEARTERIPSFEDQYGAWRRTQSRPKRPLSTIVISPSVKHRLVSDAKEFLESETFYAERGLPYRRGYLLYGQPGSGKSSMIHSLAGELGLNIYVITLSNKSLTDDTLGELVSDTPSR